jgi:hypothetical protein
MGRGASRYADDWLRPGLVELGADDLQPLEDVFDDASTVVYRPLADAITRPLPDKLPPLRLAEPSPPRPPPRQALPSRKALLAGTRRPVSEPRPGSRRWVGLALLAASLWAIVVLLVMAGVVAAGALG